MLHSFLVQWLLVAGSSIILVLCDILATYWGKTGNLLALISMSILAPLGFILFALLTQSKGLAISSGIVNMIVLLIGIGVGVGVFRDEITTRQVIGLLMALGAIVLLH
jgi:drug/metabolite transporter (DMT)-like permease